MVLTNQPLRAILRRPDTSERLTKWAMKLSEFDIQYRPRPALKVQVLADFIAECPTTDQGSEDENPGGAAIFEPDPGSTWVLHIDGASNS